MSARVIPKEQLTAYQRWELGSFAELHAVQPSQPQAATQRSTGERERAAQEGYRTGYAGGYEEGKQLAQAELQRLHAVLNSAQEQIALLEKDLAADVLDLAIELARHVLRGELSARRDALLPAVREAISSIPETAANPKLLLHPSDVEVIRADLGEALKLGNWQIIEDLMIEPGGCRVSSLSASVDATLDTRWKRVLAGLGKTDAWTRD